jgi:hypothetical protein
MAKTSTLSADAALYEADFYLWVERQAELLRKSRFRDLDLAHLIEEVEDLGASQRNEVFGRSQRIMQHLLKLQFSPATEPRAGWEHTVDDQRDRLELTITASLRAELERTLAERYARSRRRAAKDLARYGETPDLPVDCPYTVEQILDLDWFPGNLHGIEDPGR